MGQRRPVHLFYIKPCQILLIPRVCDLLLLSWTVSSRNNVAITVLYAPLTILFIWLGSGVRPSIALIAQHAHTQSPLIQHSITSNLHCSGVTTRRCCTLFRLQLYLAEASLLIYSRKDSQRWNTMIFRYEINWLTSQHVDCFTFCLRQHVFQSCHWVWWSQHHCEDGQSHQLKQMLGTVGSTSTQTGQSCSPLVSSLIATALIVSILFQIVERAYQQTKISTDYLSCI